ncbi:hypothetical protein ACO0K9_09905 [Undibacterium sp. Ji50W]|uniref:hypothetical protein n=1 Tax=Undibacterium sp. Ji50W TaxID=3413041 RepID=UPI003BF34827
MKALGALIAQFRTNPCGHPNSAIDSGKFTSISVTDVHAAIEKRSLLKFLQASCQGSIDLSIHLSGAFGDFETFYEEAIGGIFDGYAGDERRK